VYREQRLHGSFKGAQYSLATLYFALIAVTVALQVEEEIWKVGEFKDAQDVESIMPVLSGWLAVLGAAGASPQEAQQRQGERPRWRKPPRLVWNALCTLLPLLAAPALEHVVHQIEGAVATIADAAVTGSQNQCACSLSVIVKMSLTVPAPAHGCVTATTDNYALRIWYCRAALPATHWVVCAELEKSAASHAKHVRSVGCGTLIGMCTCRTFAMRCLSTVASTLRAALWRHCATDASVLVVQLSEVVRGCLDPQLVEHGIAALQAVAEASVAAGVLHMRCRGSFPQVHA